ncbi:hypothetical protein [Phytohabitans kaempferiae]|uniref:Uncharacterized protein n=1 Tax=Phytohabitans kaempferiae TaxID=1620943 RepID=A0ABV6M1L8_9ACTN
MLKPYVTASARTSHRCPEPRARHLIFLWSGGEPIPVGVIAGEHTVHDGDRAAFASGLWATSVVAADSTAAQQLAVDQIRRSRH